MAKNGRAKKSVVGLIRHKTGSQSKPLKGGFEKVVTVDSNTKVKLSFCVHDETPEQRKPQIRKTSARSV